MPPTIAKRFEPTSDIVTLVMWNLKQDKGMAFATSRPYPNFIRLASKIVTGVTSHALNVALNNLILSGCCVLERKSAEETTLFMWTLEYEGEKDIPYDEPHELDPKMAMSWPKDFNKLEATRIRKTSSSSLLLSNNEEGPASTIVNIPI